MTVIVTGGAGFIGSNLIKALNARGEKQIIAVDDLRQGDTFLNLVDLEINDYLDKKDLFKAFSEGWWGKIEAVFHQGACTDTLESNSAYLMESNYQYSNDLYTICNAQKVPLIYASAATVYGRSTQFSEERVNEKPLNAYGYSKFLFDQYARDCILEKKNTAQLVGLRLFNVYGPYESHKKNASSIIFQMLQQYKNQGFVNLFGKYQDNAAGEQRRDFISIEDIVKINLYFLDHPEKSGIFNAGTGTTHSFNAVACQAINSMLQSQGQPALSLADMVKQQLIRYIPVPKSLERKYQNFTQANLDQLRAVGYTDQFIDLTQGIQKYGDWLVKNPDFFQ